MEHLRNNSGTGKRGWVLLICAAILAIAFIPYLINLVNDLSERAEAALHKRVVLAQEEPTLNFDVFQNAQARMLGGNDKRLMVFLPTTGTSYMLSGSASHYSKHNLFFVRKKIKGEYSLPAHHDIVCFVGATRKCFLGKFVK
jgi:hypothetical protein